MNHQNAAASPTLDENGEISFLLTDKRGDRAPKAPERQRQKQLREVPKSGSVRMETTPKSLGSVSRPRDRPRGQLQSPQESLEGRRRARSPSLGSLVDDEETHLGQGVAPTDRPISNRTSLGEASSAPIVSRSPISRAPTRLGASSPSAHPTKGQHRVLTAAAQKKLADIRKSGVSGLKPPGSNAPTEKEPLVPDNQTTEETGQTSRSEEMELLGQSPTVDRRQTKNILSQTPTPQARSEGARELDLSDVSRLLDRELTRLKGIQDEEAASRTQLAEIRKQNAWLKEAMAELQDKREDSRCRLAAAEATRSAIEKERDIYQARCTTLERRVAAHLDEKRKLQNALEAAETSNKELDDLYQQERIYRQEADDQVRKKQDELRRSQRDTERNAAQIDRLRRQLSDKEAAHSKEVATYRKIILRREKDVASWVNERDRLNDHAPRKLSSAETPDDLSLRVEQLVQKFSSLRDENQKLKDQLGSKDKQIQILLTFIQGMKDLSVEFEGVEFEGPELSPQLLPQAPLQADPQPSLGSLLTNFKKRFCISDPQMPEPGSHFSPIGDLPEGHRPRTTQPWKENYKGYDYRNPNLLERHQQCNRDLPELMGIVTVTNPDGSVCTAEDDKDDPRRPSRKRGPMTIDQFTGLDPNQFVPVLLGNNLGFKQAIIVRIPPGYLKFYVRATNKLDRIKGLVGSAAMPLFTGSGGMFPANYGNERIQSKRTIFVFLCKSSAWTAQPSGSIGVLIQRYDYLYLYHDCVTF
ncbi:hypothetical protein ABW19_dt0205015 [Dactylella cylindrospora]|nr:hypothetical protein ABW19_dt0205015 [Dactylella cylindrospora]